MFNGMRSAWLYPTFILLGVSAPLILLKVRIDPYFLSFSLIQIFPNFTSKKCGGQDNK
jgi:hypothetical protein